MSPDMRYAAGRWSPAAQVPSSRAKRPSVVSRFLACGTQRPAVHRLQADPPQSFPLGSGGPDVQMAIRFGRDLLRVLLAEQARGRLEARPAAGFASVSWVKYASWAMRTPVSTVPWADTVTGTRVWPRLVDRVHQLPEDLVDVVLGHAGPFPVVSYRVMPSRYPQARHWHSPSP